MLAKVHRWTGGEEAHQNRPNFEEMLVNLEYIVAIFPADGERHRDVRSRIHLSDIAEPYHTIHVMEPLSHFLEFEGR